MRDNIARWMMVVAVGMLPGCGGGAHNGGQQEDSSTQDSPSYDLDLSLGSLDYGYSGAPVISDPAEFNTTLVEPFVQQLCQIEMDSGTVTSVQVLSESPTSTSQSRFRQTDLTVNGNSISLTGNLIAPGVNVAFISQSNIAVQPGASIDVATRPVDLDCEDCDINISGPLLLNDGGSMWLSPAPDNASDTPCSSCGSVALNAPYSATVSLVSSGQGSVQINNYAGFVIGNEAAVQFNSGSNISISLPTIPGNILLPPSLPPLEGNSTIAAPNAGLSPVLYFFAGQLNANTCNKLQHQFEIQQALAMEDSATVYINGGNVLLKLEQNESRTGYQPEHQARLFDDLILQVVQGAGWIVVVLENGMVHVLEDRPFGMHPQHDLIFDDLHADGFEAGDNEIIDIEIFEHLIIITVQSTAAGTIDTYHFEVSHSTTAF